MYLNIPLRKKEDGYYTYSLRLEEGILYGWYSLGTRALLKEGTP
jgi:hypothetical protein